MVVILCLFCGLTFEGQLHASGARGTGHGVLSGQLASYKVSFVIYLMSVFFSFENSTTCYLRPLDIPEKPFFPPNCNAVVFHVLF